jgi:hypothetical protein
MKPATAFDDLSATLERPMNGINVDRDSTGVILTMVLDGKATTWMHFTQAQAMTLIAMIEEKFTPWRDDK